MTKLHISNEHHTSNKYNIFVAGIVFVTNDY